MMKNYLFKFWVMLCVFGLNAIFNLNAQTVNTYGFSSSSGTYTPLVGGTALTGVGPGIDSGSSPLTNIGFTFNYGGNNFTQFSATSNGYIQLGAVGGTTTYTPISTVNNTIAFMARDGRTAASEGVTYALSGVAPNQVLTIQFVQQVHWNNATDIVNAQIKLYETTNVVEIVYGNPPAATSNYTAQVGLRGASAAGFSNRTSTTSWSATTAGAANTNTMTWSPSVLPANGQTYRWSPPPAAPPAPTEVAGTPNCVTGTDIQITGTPSNPDVVWYWQGTNPTGTSTANPVSSNFNVLTNNTYYARAFNTVFNVWSTTSSSIVINSIPVAATPPAPTADLNPSCVTTGSQLSSALTGNPDLTYYWQGTNSTGTSTANEAATDLTTTPFTAGSTGTYYISAFDAATSCWSPTSSIAITVQTAVPAAPTASPAVYNICGGLSDFDITATAPGSFSSTTTAFPSGPLALAIPDNTPSGLTNVIAVSTIPAGAIVTGLSVTLNITHTFDGDLDISLMGANGTTIELTTDNGGAGDNYTNTILSSTATNPVTGGTAPFTGTFLPEGNLASLYSVANGNWSLIIGDDAGGDTGTLNDWTISITYTMPADLNWYDAATAGTVVGTGSPFDCIGNSVMADPSSNGSYDFYAETVDGVCVSSTRTLVTVNVLDVNVTLTPIDETCIGYMNGSFEISDTLCGTAPFTVDVDGGGFGPIPTDLGPGTYTVTVRDNNGFDSAPTTVVIGTTSTVIPENAEAVQSVYNYCVSSNPMDIEAQTPPAGCPIVVNIFSAGWGDGTTWTVTDNGGATVLSGGTYGNGYNDTQTIPAAANGPYNLNITSTLNDNAPSYSVSVGGTVVFSGTAPVSTTTVIGPFNCPQFGSPEWYDDAAMSNMLGDQPTLNTLGTSVMPTAVEGSYDFYLFGNLNGCYSTTGTLVTVNVNSVLVDLTPIDETCTGYSNGSFAIANIECGTGPFLYSIDGGAFGPVPSNLTAGVYTVIVQDANMDESAPITLTIGTTDTFIPDAPTAAQDVYFVCSGATTNMIEATAGGSGTSTVTTGAISIAIPDATAPAGISSDLIMSAVPSGATVTDISVTMNITHTFTGDLDITLTAPNATNIELSTDNGGGGDNFINTVFSNNAATLITAGTAPFTGTFLPEGDLTTLFSVPNGTWTLNIADDAGGDVGTLNDWTLAITYTLPSIDVEWYDMATNGNLEGTGSPFESVGTGILPSPAAVGTYEFYAGALAGGCYSIDRTLVTVNVNDVNVELTAVDASCNNSPTGSFIVSNVICGTAPFTASVDGSSFGPIPTDLMAGTYSIVIMDDNGGTSGTYTLVVGEADGPSGAYMEDITDNGGQVSWNANGNETEWNVEWGLPGFTPGTGTSIGSTQAMDTFAIITGLDGNTNYDVYVSANCGAGTTTGSWDMVNWTTDCGIYTLPFEETFEDDSETRVCWYNENEVGTADWTYQTGSSGGVVTTAFEGTKNARFVSAVGTNSPITKLASPRFDFTGQDSVALIFAYAQEVWFGDQNVTKVYTTGSSSVWTEIASYTSSVDAWTVDTLFVADTTVQIAFEGINNFGHANVVDHVRFMPCTLNSGIDGSADVCRLDGTFDLNTIVTKGEDFGTWTFAQNPGVLNGSIVSVSALPAGTFDFHYIVKTPCATDTTFATLTIFPPSSAGVDGTITACRNEPIYLLSGLSGNVDLGGQWYNPANQPTDVSITTSNIPGNYNFDYIVSNGVCPNDTSNILVTVGSCDYLDIQELVFGDMNVYPNPTDGLVFISNASSSETFSYEILDVKGKVLTAKEAAIYGTTTTEVSMEKLEPGVYMIRVYNSEAEKTFRIVKQ